jgi:hypothetical protein
MTGTPTALPMTQIRALPVPSTMVSPSLTTCLSGLEHRLLATYRHPRRRLEFVAGRLALKHALLDRRKSAVRICRPDPLREPLLSAAQRMRIVPDRDGHPRLWIDGDPQPVRVSIAHAAGWAAAGCSSQPIGVDIVDLAVPTAVPDDTPWLAGVDLGWRVRLRALLWGLRECLLKSGQIAAKTTWDLAAIRAVPVCAPGEIIARWPTGASLAPLQVHIDNKVIAGACAALGHSALLVMILIPVPHRSAGSTFDG